MTRVGNVPTTSDIIPFPAGTPAWILAAAVVVLLGVLVRRRTPGPQDAPTEGIPLVARGAAQERTLLAGPPMVDGCTLRDWLVHHAHRDGVWEDVVVRFHERAVADPRVAPYFTGSDPAWLKRHFLAALTVLTHDGLHRYTVERMAAVHRGVTTPAGRPITGPVWDVVVSVLIGVVLDHGAPASVVEPLGALLDRLRAAVVVEPSGVAGTT